ncbi:hypothetical protein [Microbacterium sp. NPDC089696]|uniref:hypothetical protein n=1 Tax=Microbacterium sp. NPDC089696 TaxID=3364199 RepID=UPI0038249A96
MEQDSIGSIIRAVIEETPAEFQSDDIAAKVIERIPADMYATYLHELISSRVASEAGYLRSKVTPSAKNLSTKQRLIRDEYWPRFLAQKIALPTGYKALADATTDDLIFIARIRRSQANDLLGKAQQFEALAELMRKSGARTLGRLDPHIGEKAIAA